MNRPLIAGALCAVTVLAVLAKGKPSDPVLMTVGGKDVPLSEFEYLYHKNNSQQLQPQTLDEYVDMFVTYKLKVADAEAAGIDTTKKFIDEFNGYRNELAAPYIVDKVYEDSLLQVAYNHTLTNVDVSHIMVALKDEAGNEAPQIALIDSIHDALAAGADFATLAKRYSTDRSAARNGGHIGYISGGQYPYEFESVAYDTPEGQLSEPFTTRFGRHVIFRGAERKAPGEVLVRHILKKTQGLSPADAAAKKAEIDSIAALLASGTDFQEIARAESEDPGSAAKGGELPWFGIGRMVPEFETVAFEMADGTVSKPFQSSFGWHIIQKIGHKEPAPFEEAAPNLRKMMERDARVAMINAHRDQHFRKLYPSKLDNKAIETAKAIVRRHEALDSATLAEIAALKLTAFTTDGKKITMAEVVNASKQRDVTGTDEALAAFDKMVDRAISRQTLEAVRAHLAVDNADYRNLLGEYRDGMLLFEISNRNVWERASKDMEGLNAFFNANRSNYTWQKPHYKGYVVMATTDSVADLARKWLDSEGRNIAADSLATGLRRAVGNSARIERVVTAKGDNAIVDYVAFGGKLPVDSKKNSRWNAWFAFKGRVIDQPEEASDVKAPVSADYQQQLENEWIDSLHKKYPVKINNKILKKVK